MRLCLHRKDYARGQILLRKVSPRAFVDVAKKGTNVGEIGIEGSMIEPPAEVRVCVCVEGGGWGLICPMACAAFWWLPINTITRPVLHCLSVSRAATHNPCVGSKAKRHTHTNTRTTSHAQGTPELMELKVRYYQLSITYHAHNANYLEMCRCYRAIYETQSVADDADQWVPVLKKICWLVVLAPADSDQVRA